MKLQDLKNFAQRSNLISAVISDRNTQANQQFESTLVRISEFYTDIKEDSGSVFYTVSLVVRRGRVLVDDVYQDETGEVLIRDNDIGFLGTARDPYNPRRFATLGAAVKIARVLEVDSIEILLCGGAA